MAHNILHFTYVILVRMAATEILRLNEEKSFAKAISPNYSQCRSVDGFLLQALLCLKHSLCLCSFM